MVKLNILQMEFIEALPQGNVIIEELNNAKVNNPYFEEWKVMLQQRIDDIDSGKSILGSFEEFEVEMDEFEKELELKYAS